MNTNLRIALVLMVTAMFGTTAWADGKHNVKFTIKNQTAGKILVYTYNGADPECVTGHKEYVIGKGGQRTAKCHGNGKGRCKFAVWAGTSTTANKITKQTLRHCENVDQARKGETCKINGRKKGEYECS